MFSQMSVILPTAGVWQTSPWADNTLGRHPPWVGSPPGQTPPPPGGHPSRQTPPGSYPHGQTPPWADAPRQTPPCPMHAGIHPRRPLQWMVLILLECILVSIFPAANNRYLFYSV